MTNRFRHKLTATLLTLCVVVSGWVGINPRLHRLVEHGGQGAAHTHRDGATHWHDHGDDRPHRHDAPVEISFPPAGNRLERGFQSHPFGSLPVRELLSRLLKLWSDDRASEEPRSDHRHNSLAQSLSDGLVEAAFAWDAPAAPPTQFLWVGTPSRNFFPASDWSPDSASRAPPAFSV